MKHRWKFLLVLEDGQGYLLASGDMVHNCSDVADFIAEDEVAEAEAYRRMNLFEEKTGEVAVDVVAESYGKIA